MEYVRTVFAILFIVAFTTIFVYGTFFYSSPPWWMGQLVFQEDFNGGKLNATIWEYAIARPGKQKSMNRSRFLPPMMQQNSEKIRVRSGHLELSPSVSFDFQEDRLVQEIQVRQKAMEFSQGAFLIRARLPEEPHLGSTIRLVHSSPCFRGQILIVRKPAAGPPKNSGSETYKGTKLVFGAHFLLRKRRLFHGNDTGGVKILKNVSLGSSYVNLGGQFHDFGLRWSGGKLRWYMDDVLYYEMSLDAEYYWNPKSRRNNHNACFQNGLFSVPMKFLVDLEVHSGFEKKEVTDDAEQDSDSSKLLIDWVKVYEFP